ncbi:uncharacterized protein FIBRA_02007 [Fibroporia radiculosa]|uniref:Uncharacterized protein n=1 Tax=Fibroporia radiculosa TaxID=599839 RepID=J4HU83_9APHY|nr:uncharacterized protein FIBRA_02007 [Fibroporia radiculosa]CCL99982.1 predicted protein [Fibroporia radiculosa]
MEMRMLTTERIPFSTLVLRDGTVYFSVLLLLNIADIILFSSGIFQNLSAFNLLLTPLLLSQFLLNLREASTGCSTDTDQCQMSSLNILGNLGASLNYTSAFQEDEQRDGEADEIQDESPAAVEGLPIETDPQAKQQEA